MSLRLVFLLVGGALATLAVSAPALAAPMMVYVSTKGADAPGCGTIAAPCRQLLAAQDAVAAGGYIIILDPGEYESFAAYKSITVANESNGAALLRPNAAVGDSAAVGTIGHGQLFSAKDVLRLRGLTLVGGSGYTFGIVVNYHGRLEVVDCVVRDAEIGIFLNDT